MFQLFIDGLKQGYVQKAGPYGSSSGYCLRDLGTVEFASAGQKAFQFRVTGRNSESQKSGLIFDYLELVLTSHFEAEKLSTDSTTQLKSIVDGNLSGRAGLLLVADAAGQSVTYKVTIPSPGTYGVTAGIRKGDRSGIVQLAIDGVNQGLRTTITRQKLTARSSTLAGLHSPRPARKHFSSWSPPAIQKAEAISSSWITSTWSAEQR